MILIEQKIYFYLLILVPVLVGVYSWFKIWKKRAKRRFADKETMKRLSPEKSFSKGWLKLFVICLAVISMVMALANFKMGTKMETVKREGVDLVFAIDVSKSMLAEDAAPNRLQKAEGIVSQIISSLKGDRVGIVAYAGSAYPQLPLTSDYTIAKMFLQNINTDMLSSQGTAIDEAIKVGMDYFGNDSKKAKIIILISDGEDHQMGSETSGLIGKASEAGIKIFTIGVGTEKGSTIPIMVNGQKMLKRDSEGEVVITRLNKHILENIASQTNGIYLSGESKANVVDRFFNKLDKIEKNEYEAQTISDYKDQFQWFVGIAIFLLAMEMFITYKRNKLIRRLWK